MTDEQRFPHFNLKQYLVEQKIEYREWESGDHVELAINCLKCRERGESRADTKKRLWVHEAIGLFHCYNCGWDGQLPRLVMALANTTVEGALRVMRGKISSLDNLNFRLTHESYDYDNGDEDSELQDVAFPHGFESFDDCKDRSTLFHGYLKKRGLSLQYAINNGWGFSRVGYVANRIVVPTYMDDRLVFWQARDVLDTAHPAFGTKEYRKVLNPSGVSKSKVLYGYDVAKAFDEVILVEGFMDAAKAGPAAVAVNGKTLHAAQVEWLTRTKARKVCLLLDPDAFTDGRRRGDKVKPSSVEAARDLLAIYFTVRTVRLPEGRDAGSYRTDELRAILAGRHSERAPEHSLRG